MSGLAAALCLAVLCSPAGACPGLEWEAEPYLGELTFNLHSGLNSLSLTSRAGGIFNLRDCGLEGPGLTGYRGDGLIRVRPTLLMHWYGEAPQLVIGARFTEKVFVLVHDPEGRWLFDDGQGQEPQLIIDQPPVGDYAIFLGSHGSDGFTRPGTLIISETHP